MQGLSKKYLVVRRDDTLKTVTDFLSFLQYNVTVGSQCLLCCCFGRIVEVVRQSNVALLDMDAYAKGVFTSGFLILMIFSS